MHLICVCVYDLVAHSHYHLAAQKIDDKHGQRRRRRPGRSPLLSVASALKA